MTQKVSSITYHVSNPRFVVTTGRVKEKNPERFGTMYGEFRHTDEKGNPKGDALTITQKVIDVEDALSPVFAIDLDAGTLTLPAGERGRKAAAGVSQDDLSAMLDALREESASESESESATE